MILLSLSTKLSMSSWSRQELNIVISEMQVLLVVSINVFTYTALCDKFYTPTLKSEGMTLAHLPSCRTCISEITLFISACLDHELILGTQLCQKREQNHVSCDQIM